MKPGTFLAKIADWGISMTKAGKPQMAITFDFQDEGGAPKTMTWFGSFNEGMARKITLQTLRDCGFTSTKEDDLLKDDALDRNKELEIVIKENEYEGKTSLRISFINIPGIFKNKLSRIDAIQALKGLDLRGDLIKAQKEAPKGTTTGVEDEEDVPF